MSSVILDGARQPLPQTFGDYPRASRITTISTLIDLADWSMASGALRVLRLIPSQVLS